MWMRTRIERPGWINHHRLPGMDRALLTQIEKDFGEEAGVQLGVGLKLYFHKEQRPGGLIVRRVKHPIHAKSGLLEFDRLKVIACCVTDRLGNQVEQQLRQGLKQAIEER